MIYLLFILCVGPANGETIHVAEGESIQTAMNEASPGDVIVLAAGTYTEDLSTEVSGSEDAPITVIGADGETVTITSVGEVLQVDDPHWVFENLIFDGQFGESDTIDINDGATGTELVGVEVRRSGRDCIDMGSPSGVRIADSSIHSCLWFDTDEDERRDAHGITGGAVQNLTISNTEIHTFSGDGLQFDPGREEPGWNNIEIRNSRIYLEALTVDANGFTAGQVPGENAIDTKTHAEAERAALVVEDTEVWGFSDGMDTSDQAAFFIKEGVDATFRRVTVRDSEIAFRLRGPTPTRPQGARVRIENAVLYNLDVGVRYEKELEELTILFTTFGMNINTFLAETDSSTTSPVMQNNLFVHEELPSLAEEANGNRAVPAEDLVDSDARNHRLEEGSPAIDAGVEIDGIETDREGLERWIGAAPDAGAHEYGQAMGGDTGDTGWADTASPDETEPELDTGTAADSEEEEPEDQVPGIGAAEQVGEMGGCGCGTSDARSLGVPWWLAGIVLVHRRRNVFVCRTNV
jgi:hypothetical protein